jgi:hypothetical protein
MIDTYVPVDEFIFAGTKCVVTNVVTTDREGNVLSTRPGPTFRYPVGSVR